MKNLSLIASALAMLGLTACEKGLDEGIADVAPAGQVTNSVLQVRTRSGGSAGEEATVAFPIAVYVFAGEECRAVQTIGDEGQTLNIGLTEGTYTVYAIGGASAIGASSIAFGLHEFCGRKPLKATRDNSQKQVSLWKQ